MAVYNGEATIREVLETVQAQTYRDFEILVIDDGSKDRSAEIAREMGARVLIQENAGLGAVRKRLVEEALGDYIAFIDHDDDWVPDKLEKQMAVLDQTGAVMVHSDCWYLYDDGRVVERNLVLQSNAGSFDQVLPDNWIVASSAVFSRNAMLKAGNFIPETVRCSDWYGWIILASQGQFIHFPEKQVRYRVLSTSLANAGYRFQEAKRFLMKDIVLDHFEHFFGMLPASDQAKYRKLVQRNIGIALSTMAKHLDSEGKFKEAKPLHREALKLAPMVPRVWTRAVKSILKR